MDLKDVARTLLTVAAVIGLTIVLAPIISVLSLLSGRAADSLIRVWCKGILCSAGVKKEVRGLNRLPSGQCVLVCNHQSHFDAPLIMSQMPKHVRFVAKKQLFRIPIFGWALFATGNIKVDRTGSERDKERLQKSAAKVRDRVSILFFAEGTRSPDGTLGPFKKGAAMLAIEAGVPLVPIAVAGTGAILPKGKRLIRGGCAAMLNVGDPIPTDRLTSDDRDLLTERARAAVSGLLQEANDWVRAKREP